MDQRFGPYQVGETIGRGTFAKVKVAVHEATKTKVALKVIPRKVMDEDPKSEIKIKREIKILQILRHPHVMRLYDVVQTRHDIILVLEYVSGGELFDYISRRGRLHENLARLFFQQLISAVAYCHTYNVAHRDLKPENILLEQNMKSIKIGDFGLSSIMRDGKLFETSCGTPNYAAPEVVSGKLYFGREADVWSCGVVLYTMLAGGLPFDDTYVNVLFKKIQNATYQTPSYVPSAAQDLIARLLVPDPLERATIEQIFQHPWVREQFPAYLVTIHTEALYQSSRFARDALSFIEAHMDSEVVAYVANRFRVDPQRVVAMVGAAEAECVRGGAVDQTDENRPYDCRRRLAAMYSVADEKVKPEPLVIPLAETRLRDEHHDIVVAYNILLDRKLARRAIPEGGSSGGTSGGQQRHADPNGSPPADGAGAPVSSSLTASRFGAVGSHSYGGAAAIEYGSLREYSLGPQSHKPAPVVPRKPGNLQRAPDGTLHFTPIFGLAAASSPPPGPFVDPYTTGYNKVAAPALTVRSQGSRTLLGALFHTVETCELTAPPPMDAPGGATATHSNASGGSQASAHRLLAPVEDAAPSQSGQPSPCISVCSSTAAGLVGANNTSNAVSSSHCKFGGDFMRNGVAFRRTDAQTTYDTLIVALKLTGFTYKTMLPFSVAAFRPGGEKVLCKVFKIEKQDYLVDVRVSQQSGMGALEGACELLQLLLRCSDTGVPLQIFNPDGMRVLL